MARKDPLLSMTIKIHPRYAGKILEALELAQITARQNMAVDKFSRGAAAADYAMAADIVGNALGAHIAKEPEHTAWRRWLAERVIAFAVKIHAQPKEGGF